MNNRINEIRWKISSLRAEMMKIEAAVRDQGDCTEAWLRLMPKRAELLVLLGEWKAARGSDRLPTVEEQIEEKPSTAREATESRWRHRRPHLKVSLGGAGGPKSGPAQSKHHPASA
jgi:chorismate mutase